MASWAIERRMSIPPTTLTELRIREAKSLLAWSAALEDETVTYEEFQTRCICGKTKPCGLLGCHFSGPLT